MMNLEKRARERANNKLNPHHGVDGRIRDCSHHCATLVSSRLASLIIIGAINSALKLSKVFIATFFPFHPRKDARQYQLYFIIPLRLVLLGV